MFKAIFVIFSATENNVVVADWILESVLKIKYFLLEFLGCPIFSICE